MCLKAVFLFVNLLIKESTMTTYDANSKKGLRSPDAEIEIGVTICTRQHIEIDMGHGEYALVPAQDKRVHIKTTWGNYTDQFVLDYVAKKYGRAWVVMSHNLCLSDDLHPF